MTHFFEICSGDDKSRRSVSLCICRRDEGQSMTMMLLQRVVGILQDRKVSLQVSFNANFLNPLEVVFDEYTLAHQEDGPNLVKSWGDHRGAFLEIARIPGVSLSACFEDDLRVYTLDREGMVTGEYYPDPG